MSSACLQCVVVVGLLSSSIHAFPSGAGGCSGGQAAVEGAHLTTDAVTGFLSDGGFELVVNDQFSLDPDTLTSLEIGKPYSLSIRSSGPFRGILIRMEGDGITVTPASGFQEAAVCDGDGALGITHTENSDKTGLTSIGSFEVSSTQDLGVDVTIVVSNNGQDGSEYYYNPYLLETTEVLPSDVPLPATIPPDATPNVTATVPPTPEVTIGSSTMKPTSNATTEETIPPTPEETIPATPALSSGPGDNGNVTAAPAEKEETDAPTPAPESAEPEPTDAPTVAPGSSARETSFFMATTASSLALAWMMNLLM